MNPNRPTPRYIIIKIAEVKDKERILKAAKEKQRVMYERTSMKLSADFCAETLQGRRDGKIYSKGWKGKICNLRYSTQQKLCRPEEVERYIQRAEREKYVT